MFVTLEMMRIVFLQRHVNKSKSHLMQYPDTYNEIALFDFNVIQDFLIRLKEAKIELSFSFKHFKNVVLKIVLFFVQRLLGI